VETQAATTTEGLAHIAGLRAGTGGGYLTKPEDAPRRGGPEEPPRGSPPAGAD
jgi:hypothetical protein